MRLHKSANTPQKEVISDSGIRSWLENLPLFLLGIPVIFILHAAIYYNSLLNWSAIWPALVIYSLVPTIIYGTFRLLGLEPIKTGMSMLPFLLVFYFFHWWHDFLRGHSFLRVFSKYTVQLPFLTAISCLVVLLIWFSRIPLRKWQYRINLILLFLLAGGLLQFGYESLRDKRKEYDQADPNKLTLKNYTPCDTCSKPDIYFLLFDGYTSLSVLKEEFSYQSNSLRLFLQEKGFFLADSSKSNYNFTHMSMASELNLDYLKNIDLSEPFHTKDFFESYYTIYHNELTGILKKEGYAINNLSIFPIANAPSRITPFLTELNYRSVVGQTFLNKLKRDIGWHWTDTTKIPTPAQVEKMDNDLKRLDETIQLVIDQAKESSSKPIFTYAHFIIPHETYYFDSTGRRLDPHYTFNQEINKSDYLQQLVFTNKFIIMPLVDSIFRYSKRPFIILLQGDHGYRNYPPEKTFLEFANLFAIYWPGQKYDKINRKITSVNTFRLVLNHCFEQNLPLLKDSSINLMKVFQDEIID